MREVLIEVTKTLSDMEEREMANDAADSRKSRMSVANKRMMDSARSQEEGKLEVPRKK